MQVSGRRAAPVAAAATGAMASRKRTRGGGEDESAAGAAAAAASAGAASSALPPPSARLAATPAHRSSHAPPPQRHSSSRVKIDAKGLQLFSRAAAAAPPHAAATAAAAASSSSSFVARQQQRQWQQEEQEIQQEEEHTYEEEGESGVEPEEWPEEPAAEGEGGEEDQQWPQQEEAQEAELDPEDVEIANRSVSLRANSPSRICSSCSLLLTTSRLWPCRVEQKGRARGEAAAVLQRRDWSQGKAAGASSGLDSAGEIIALGSRGTVSPYPLRAHRHRLHAHRSTTRQMDARPNVSQRASSAGS